MSSLTMIYFLQFCEGGVKQDKPISRSTLISLRRPSPLFPFVMCSDRLFSSLDPTPADFKERIFRSDLKEFMS